ncbi:MAG: beta-ketoacyl synthase N-terminal-like domain-containing protein [Candidatus Sericytochromatia bacterium]|nr:beta-ketoacyl synthase N-terminal-like domain-containing protein [Candidatus Sericytochromatia bacterium]
MNGNWAPIAVIGAGGVFPDAPDLETFWSNILLGRCASRDVPEGRWVLPSAAIVDPTPGTPDRVLSSRACLLDEALMGREELGIPPETLGTLDPLYTVGLTAATRCWRSLRAAPANLERAGLVMGNIVLPDSGASADAIATLDGEGSPRPAAYRGAGLVSGLVARALGLGLGGYAIDAACASSLYAIKLACAELAAGRADLMLAGGLSRPDSLYTQMGFSQLRALSPSGRCAPFDAEGDGLVVGEGAGLVALKRLADAERDGDQIWGVIRGIGTSNDLEGSLLAPHSEGQLRAMREAYRQAGWQPGDVDLVECHATGTPRGDAVEVASLQTLRADLDTPCVLTSVKSNVGHLLTAAGAAGFIKTLFALRNGVLPPTAQFKQSPTEWKMAEHGMRVLSAPEPWWETRGRARRAAVSAFGFGGINAHVLLEEYGAPGGAEVTLSTARLSQMLAKRLRRKDKASPQEEPPPSPVAVVGMGCRIGAFKNLREFQEFALAGVPLPPHKRRTVQARAGIDLPSVPESLAGCYLPGDLEVATAGFRIPPRDWPELLPQQALMLLAADEALRDVGPAYQDRRVRHPRAGAYIGIGLDARSTDYHRRWHRLSRQEGSPLPALTADRTLGALGGMVASRLAREFRFGGPTHTVQAEEMSAYRALEAGIRALQRREIELALVGAVDVPGDPRLLASRQREGDGLPTAEGAGALVLKRLEDAQRDGDRIYAVIEGLASASSPRLNRPLAGPDADAISRAISAAWDEAQLLPAAAGLLELDGTASKAEHEAVSTIWSQAAPASLALARASQRVGRAGLACGMVSLLRTALALYHEVLPGWAGHQEAAPALEALHTPRMSQYWFFDRAQGPRRAGVNILGREGGAGHVVLAAALQPPAAVEQSNRERLRPLGAPRWALFALAGDDTRALTRQLERLTLHARAERGEASVAHVARSWWQEHGVGEGNLGLAIVARDHVELEERIREARRVLAGEHLPAGDPRSPVASVFFSSAPHGPDADLAFVFPGSGNHWPGMGTDLWTAFPQVARLQDTDSQLLATQVRPARLVPWRRDWPEGWQAETETALSQDHRTTLLAQVAHGALMHDLLRLFGVGARAVMGYSLGETAGLVATRTWRDRDELTRRMVASKLFTVELGGRCAAAARTWGLPAGMPAAWVSGLVDRPAQLVRQALLEIPQAYLLIVNTPGECVVGGAPSAVEALVEKLRCAFIPIQGVTTVHCEVAGQVEGAYRALHDLPTNPPHGVRFYSGFWGRAYDVTRAAAAQALVGQALSTLEFPTLVRTAYQDGVRIFVELGPRHSCTRMIQAILGDAPHAARSACVRGVEGELSLLRLLGHLHAERVAIDLTPLYGQLATPWAAQVRPTGPVARVPLHAGGLAVAAAANRPSEVAIAPSESPASPAQPSPAPIVTARIRRRGKPRTDLVAPSSREPEPLAEKPSPGAVSARLPRRETGKRAEPFHSPRTTGGEALMAAVRPEPRVEHGAPVHSPGVALAERQDTVSALRRWMDRANDGLACVTVANHQAREAYAALEAENRSGEESIRAIHALITRWLPRTESVSDAPVWLDRAGCLAYARGQIEPVLGAYFAPIDAYPTRVRLPDEPLMLVDRILSVTGEPGSLTQGTIVTEHDVKAGAWYLDGHRIPTCVAVEAGQADLFLSGWLGIDFKTRGLAVYRLLDAVVTFHGPLPGPGETIRYDIAIDRFIEQSGVTLFFFRFDATVAGRPLMTMREGCAGFFTAEQLAEGKGIVFSALESRTLPGRLPPDWTPLLPMGKTPLDASHLAALRDGDLVGAFGQAFSGLPFTRAATLPDGLMRLVDRVCAIEPTGGRFGLGLIRAEHDVVPDAWYLKCHFVDDQVMPGTLMYECCLHTMRIFLMRLGWVGPAGTVSHEPVVGVQSRLRCRGQVLATSKVVTYEVSFKELGYEADGTPFALADALMLADGKPIVFISDMSIRLSGLRRVHLQAMWELARANRSLGETSRAPVVKRQEPRCQYGPESILAFAVGNPSEAFGERYRIFDRERVIARLPGPPYMFLDRVVQVSGAPWVCEAGAACEAHYDIPTDAWYFRDEGQPTMPFAVLLEVALQPCGWLAAYVGSALTSPVDLSFRNLGGKAIQSRPVGPQDGTLVTHARLTKVSQSSGMIIQEFEFSVTCQGEAVYTGWTMFGFFTKQALSQQVGLRGVEPSPLDPRQRLPFPAQFGPMPTGKLALVGEIDRWETHGGDHGLGFMRGRKRVDPADWYFAAHFYQDPVCPGSLGLEALVQLMKAEVWRRWGAWVERPTFGSLAAGREHSWLYRGQIVPTNREMVVEMHVKRIDEETRTLVADGILSVDGRPIYSMTDFSLSLEEGTST